MYSIELEHTECYDLDCIMNCLGLCFALHTLLYNIPGGVYTCSDAIIEFNREDVI